MREPRPSPWPQSQPRHSVARQPARWLVAIFAATALLSLSGCMGRYFHPAGAPPAEPPRYAPGELRWKEYWTGVVFNGEKIGFSHLTVRPIAEEPGHYRIHSDASLVIRLLGYSKKIQLRADDVVNVDLTLVRFDYDYTIDDSRLEISGSQEGGKLHASIRNAGRATQQTLKATTPLYPSSAINLYPVLHGLKIGAQYRFDAYSGETQSILEVRQSIDGYEASELFLGSAYKLSTTASGHSATTWIDESGKPVFELALNGVLISALEGESEAKRYLALAAVNKRDALIDFSLVKPDRPIPDPRHTTRMRVVIAGAPAAPSASDTQRCDAQGGDLACEVVAQVPVPSVPAPEPVGYLQPSITVPSGVQPIRGLAFDIAADAPTSQAKIQRLLDWMQKNIERAPVDSFTALDVLRTKQAECQGHAYLYTAFARTLGIPTRMVNGLVYSEQFNGFLYHSWSESFVDGRWQPVDPTFGQLEADATHIRVTEGESPADVLPLIEWVGKVRIRVLETEPGTASPRR